MNARSNWTKSRSKSVPSSSEYVRIRRGDFSRCVDKAIELRMRAKKDAVKKQRLEKYQARRSIPRCLMPRLGIIDDKTQSRIIAQLEIPDVGPNMVQLNFQGDRLTVIGERQPQLASVPAEYHAGLLQHSRTLIGGDQRPQLIMLRGGHVTSISVPLRPPPSPQSHPVENDAHPSSSNPSEPVTMMYYNELRYGPFRRDLRLPPGTKATDIEAIFHNGMLLISWPRTLSVTADPQNAESDEVTIPIAPDQHGTPVTVNVESMEE